MKIGDKWGISVRRLLRNNGVLPFWFWIAAKFRYAGRVDATLLSRHSVASKFIEIGHVNRGAVQLLEAFKSSMAAMQADSGCDAARSNLLRYEHFGEFGFGDPKREEGSNQ